MILGVLLFFGYLFVGMVLLACLLCIETTFDREKDIGWQLIVSLFWPLSIIIFIFYLIFFSIDKIKTIGLPIKNIVKPIKTIGKHMGLTILSPAHIMEEQFRKFREGRKNV